MHGPHHPEQDRAVAHAGVEHPQRRRARVNIGELEPDPAGHHPLFAAGVDEQQVFLPVVEEAEVALWIALPGRDRGRRSRNPRRPRRPIDDRGTRGVRGHAVVVHEASDAVERLGRDPSAIAEPRGELAVIDGAAAEGGIPQARCADNSRRSPAAALGRSCQDASVEGFAPVPRAPVAKGLCDAPDGDSEPIAPISVNHKTSHPRGGRHDGQMPNRRKRSCFVAKDAPYVPHHGSHMGRWEVSHQRPMAAGRQFAAGKSSARRTPSAIAEVPSRPPNSHALRPAAKARSTAPSMARAAWAAPSWP